MVLRPLLTSLAAAVAAVAVGCSSAGSDAGVSSDDEIKAGKSRNFSAHPAIVEVDEADEVYALSDPHGHYDGLAQLLVANHLAAVGTDPTKAKWTGGKATLLVLGDVIDKGGQSLEVIDLLRTLEAAAPRAGGRVIVMMGNHEAEFLADPHNDKAMSTGLDEDGINEELAARGVDPKRMAAGADPEGRGRWLSELPLGVRVKKWFFAHGGNTQGRSLDDLRDKLEKSIAKNGFADDDITGKDSILQAQKWYGNPKDGNAGEKEVEGLGHVKHIVFGHDPEALDDREHIRMSKNGLLVKLDVALGLHEHHSEPNPGSLLHISTVGEDTYEALDAKGNSYPLD